MGLWCSLERNLVSCDLPGLRESPDHDVSFDFFVDLEWVIRDFVLDQVGFPELVELF